MVTTSLSYVLTILFLLSTTILSQKSEFSHNSSVTFEVKDGPNDNSSRSDRSISDSRHLPEASKNLTEDTTAAEGNLTKSSSDHKNISLDTAESESHLNVSSSSESLENTSNSTGSSKKVSLDESHLAKCSNCSANGSLSEIVLEESFNVTSAPARLENGDKTVNNSQTDLNGTVAEATQHHVDKLNSTAQQVSIGNETDFFEPKVNETLSEDHKDNSKLNGNETLSEGHNNGSLVEISEPHGNVTNNKTFSLEKLEPAGTNESGLSSSLENVTADGNISVAQGHNFTKPLLEGTNGTSNENLTAGQHLREGKTSKGTVDGGGEVPIDSIDPSDTSIIHTVTTFLVSNNVTLNNNVTADNLVRLGDSSETILTKTQLNSVSNDISVAKAVRDRQDLSLGAALLIRTPTPPAPLSSTATRLFAARDSGPNGTFPTDPSPVTFVADVRELPVKLPTGAKPPGMMPPPEFLLALNSNSSVEVAIGGSGTNGSPPVANFNQDGHSSITNAAADSAARPAQLDFKSFTGGNGPTPPVVEDKNRQDITAKPFSPSQPQLEGPTGVNSGKPDGNVKADKTGELVAPPQPQPLEKSQDHTPSCKDTPQPGAPRKCKWSVISGKQLYYWKATSLHLEASLCTAPTSNAEICEAFCESNPDCQSLHFCPTCVDFQCHLLKAKASGEIPLEGLMTFVDYHEKVACT